MTAFQPTTGPAFATGDRIQLVSTDPFVTIVIFEPGDHGVILRSCELSGLWWVAFDRDPEEPIRLPASALIRSEAPRRDPDTIVPLDDTDESAELPQLIPVMIDLSSLVDAAPESLAMYAPLDTSVPAVRSRQQVLAASHAGDSRLAGHSRHLAMSAFGFLD